jgi:rubrerythrin
MPITAAKIKNLARDEEKGSKEYCRLSGMTSNLQVANLLLEMSRDEAQHMAALHVILKKMKNEGIKVI